MFDPNKPTEVEERWPREWWNSDLHRVVEEHDKPKNPFLDFLTSPCGEGLLSGYSRNYATADCLSRYMRMKGFIVSYPKELDSFEKPTEERVATPGIHPRDLAGQAEEEAVFGDLEIVQLHNANGNANGEIYMPGKVKKTIIKEFTSS